MQHRKGLIVGPIALCLLLLACGRDSGDTPTENNQATSIGAGQTDEQFPDPVVELADWPEPVRRQVAEQTSALPEEEGIPLAQKASQVGELAMRYHLLERQEAAQSLYRLAANLAEEKFDWLYLHGVVSRALLQVDVADQSFQEAYAENPDYPPLLISLAEYARKNGEFDRAAELLQDALELEPGNVPATIRLAQIENQKGQFDQAVSRLRRAIEVQPKSFVAHYTLGLAYRGLGDLERAQYHLKQSEQVSEPAHLDDPIMNRVMSRRYAGEPHFESAAQAVEEQRLNDARIAMLAAVEAEPWEGVYHYRLGEILQRTADMKSALASYENALACPWQGEYPDPASKLGPVLLRLGRHGDLLNLLEAVDDRGQRPVTMFFYAEALRLAERFDEAMNAYDRVVALETAFLPARIGRVLMALRQNAYNKARSWLAEDGEREMQHPLLRQANARLLVIAPQASARDLEQAEALLRVFPEPPPNSAIAEARAMIAAARGAWSRAVSLQQLALDLAAGQNAAYRDGIAATLSAYQAQQPRREAWRTDDPIFSLPTYAR